MYFLAFLMFPIIGEYLAYINGIYLSKAGYSSIKLIIYHSVFSAIVLSIAFVVSNHKVAINSDYIEYSLVEINKIFNKAIILLAAMSIVLFFISGYKIIFGLADRGEIRVGLGILGPLHTMILGYFPVSIFVFTSVLYLNSSIKIKKVLKKKLIIILIFPFILGILSGYKAVAVSMLVPALMILYFNNFNIFRIFIFTIFSVVVLTIATSFVMNCTIERAFEFMIHRATIMSAYGTIGFWNTLGNVDTPLSDILINFMGSLGSGISSMLLGMETNNPEFLKTNLSRYVTYLVYPLKDRALAGSVNVTVTSFAHSIFVFGKVFFVFYAAIQGFVIGFIIRGIKISTLRNFPLKTALFSVYFFYVIIPMLNSGEIYMLFSLPVIVYMFVTYFFIKYLLSAKINVN